MAEPAIARFARMARGEIVGREAEEAKPGALAMHCKLEHTGDDGQLTWQKLFARFPFGAA